MPRVLVQINNLGLGGTQLNAVDLAAATSEWGYDSILVGPRDTLPESGPSLLDVAATKGVPLVTFDRAATGMRGATTVKAALALSSLAATHRADIVHAYSVGLTRAAYWGPCLLGRRPLVITAYEMEIDPEFQKWPTLIVGTQYLREEQSTRPGPTELISPPVDLGADDPARVSGSSFRKRHGISAEHCALVIVSRLEEEMKAASVQAAMEAIDKLADPRVVLVVVGTGSAAERLGAVAAGINSRHARQVVIMTGPMSDPREAYAAADVVIGMGGSAARGLGFGRPLVVSGENGRFQTFTPATAGSLFRNSFWSNDPSRDPSSELIACLGPLITGPRLREELGTFGRDFAEHHFSLRAMASNLAEVYRRAPKTYGRRGWLHDAPSELTVPLTWFNRRVTSQQISKPRPLRQEPPPSQPTYQRNRAA
jgi:hypothetical protein